MQISWLGDAGIRLQTKDTVILIDPPGAGTGFKPTRQTAQVVALTTKDGRDASSVAGEPLFITTPGEYEAREVFIYGIHIPSEKGRVHWRIEAEDMSFGHVADLDHKLDNGELAQLEGVDVLFVPVGGKSVLDGEKAAELISQIEPRLVIPIQYHVSGSTKGYGPATTFLKELGAKNTEPQSKVKILKKELPADETQVMVLAVD
jgi:L-ascorbate metabolism protein UlaG (beta-lactamase superfamily)